MKYTLYNLVKNSIDKYPDAVAQMYREKSNSDFKNKSFTKMYSEIKAISLALIDLGMKKGDKIGLIADVGHRWLPVSLGITTVGGVDVPRGTDATKEDLNYIFKHTECKIIFLETPKVYQKIESILAEFKELKTIIFFDDYSSLKVPSRIQTLSLQSILDKGKELLKTKEKEYYTITESIEEDDVATIIYTSGTTGAPKGVVHTQKSLTWEVFHSINGIDVKPYGATMGFLPPWHIAERLIEKASFHVGCAVAFTSVPNLAKDLQAVNPTFLLSVPRVWESFYNKMLGNVSKASPVAKSIFNFSHWTALTFSNRKDILTGIKFQLDNKSFIETFIDKISSIWVCFFLFLPNLFAQKILKKVKGALGNRIEFAISGAGALPEYIDRFFYSIGVPIIETYGMTETVGVSCRRNYPGTVVGTVGSPIKGVEIKLIDSNGNVVTEPNVKGVAYHRGPHIMKEYYKEPKKTSEVLSQDGWLNSGDILVWTVNGELKFAGRAKDTIVLFGGENVEPLPIEDTLKQSPYILQCVVVGQDQKTLGALIVPDKEAIQNYLKSKNITAPADIKDWKSTKEINSIFKDEIKRLNSTDMGFKSFEKVTDFYLLENEFQIGEELTQTLKVKRNVVLEKYQKEIESLYNTNSHK